MIYKRIVRPLLFKLDAEFAHDLTLHLLSWPSSMFLAVRFYWTLICEHLAYLTAETAHEIDPRYTRLLRPRYERCTRLL